MTKTATPKKTRTRRTPEQIVADLEAEISRVKARAAAKEAKQSDEGKTFMLAVKAVDKALRVAEEAKKDGMAHALETARAALGEHLVAMGVRAPVTRGPRTRKAKAQA